MAPTPYQTVRPNNMRHPIATLCLIALAALPLPTTGKENTSSEPPPQADSLAIPGHYYDCSVPLEASVSTETGKVPQAHLWIPPRCSHVRAVILAQQNMTEEAIFKMPTFRRQLQQMDVALIWVAPWFSRNWDPATGCQRTFEQMMRSLGQKSRHGELADAPVIPLGHSAQATFPWNFAACNPARTLCVISFHGDAPRTNLCGYGGANVEWAAHADIDGIPGLMIEGEYEWWEARVNPALAFRMTYPASCISFLADAGRGHFDCAPRTAQYIALFIRKSLERRLASDGRLLPVDVRSGWLAARWHPGQKHRPEAAPVDKYKGDRHDAFWYFDGEMARLTEQIYAQTEGRKMQYVGLEYEGVLVPYDKNLQGGMQARFVPRGDSLTIHIKAVYTDSTHTTPTAAHSTAAPHVDVICGPVRKVDDTTFRLYPYEAGTDNPRRSFTIWLVAVGDPDSRYKGAVQPIQITLPANALSPLLP